MKNINQKEIVLNTEICKNQDEVKFEEEFGTNEYTCSHIFVIENCRKKGRKILTTALIDIIQDEIASMKNKYSEATVIGFFQKKKNTLKSKETIKNQIACSVFDGSEGACIYETNIQQEPETFDLELHEFIEMTGNLDKYMVFEMESNKIREKLDFALKKGITNFILIAGKYSDKDLWFDLVDKVATVKGKTIIILPARMHVITKKSYMEQAINSGATIVCHGMIYGGDSKKPRINRFLDNRDMTYKVKTNLPETNTLLNSNFRDLIYEDDLEKGYRLSRLTALREGSIYCDTHKRTIVINAGK